jgi:hypothetical protein
VERGGDRRHRCSRVIDLDLWHPELERPLNHERGRPGLDRARREVVPIGLLSAEAEEQRALPHRATVVVERRDLHGLVPAHARVDARFPQKLSELHRRDDKSGLA